MLAVTVALPKIEPLGSESLREKYLEVADRSFLANDRPDWSTVSKAVVSEHKTLTAQKHVHKTLCNGKPSMITLRFENNMGSAIISDFLCDRALYCEGCQFYN
jgi:hypothetical protein